MKVGMCMPAGDALSELRLQTVEGEVDSKRICFNKQYQNLSLWVLFLSLFFGGYDWLVGWLIG